MSKSELRNAAMKGEPAPEFGRAEACAGGCLVAEARGPQYACQNECAYLNALRAADANEMLGVVKVNFPKKIEWTASEMQEDYRRRGELLREALKWMDDAYASPGEGCALVAAIIMELKGT